MVSAGLRAFEVARSGSPLVHTEIINANIATTGEVIPEFDGFSIATFTGYDDLILKLYGGEFNTGSIVLGVIYDMPHSPDLSLTMTREYGGVKEITTKGGASLSNANWTKPPAWGNSLGSWELDSYAANPSSPKWAKVSRSGRRIWGLSFSFLDSGDVWGPNQSMGSYTAVPTGGSVVGYQPYADEQAGVNAGYTSADMDSSGYFEHYLLSDYSFYSQVIHKTKGGQLPFIFQPDNSNSNSDGFAICKFDQNSFKFEQVANGVYNVSLKIREVW